MVLKLGHDPPVHVTLYWLHLCTLVWERHLGSRLENSGRTPLSPYRATLYPWISTVSSIHWHYYSPKLHKISQELCKISHILKTAKMLEPGRDSKRDHWRCPTVPFEFTTQPLDTMAHREPVANRVAALMSTIQIGALLICRRISRLLLHPVSKTITALLPRISLLWPFHLERILFLAGKVSALQVFIAAN